MQAAEYKLNRAAFDMKARQMTEKHAVEPKESTAVRRDAEGAVEKHVATPSAAATPAEPASALPDPGCQVMVDRSRVAALTSTIFTRLIRSKTE